MATYVLGVKTDPNDYDSDEPKVTPVATLTAEAPDKPITDMSLAGNEDDLRDIYEMAVDVMQDFETQTKEQMNPLQMVRFLGQSALLTPGKD